MYARIYRETFLSLPCCSSAKSSLAFIVSISKVSVLLFSSICMGMKYEHSYIHTCLPFCHDLSFLIFPIKIHFMQFLSIPTFSFSLFTFIVSDLIFMHCGHCIIPLVSFWITVDRINQKKCDLCLINSSIIFIIKLNH